MLYFFQEAGASLKCPIFVDNLRKLTKKDLTNVVTYVIEDSI